MLLQEILIMQDFSLEKKTPEKKLLKENPNNLRRIYKLVFPMTLYKNLTEL